MKKKQTRFKKTTMKISKAKYAELVQTNEFNYRVVETVFNYLLANNLVKDSDIAPDDNGTVEAAAEGLIKPIKRLQAKAKKNASKTD